MRVNRVVTQALRAMTVEVRSASSKDLCGTAVFVSPQRFLATCAHVVRDCDVDPRSLDSDPVLLRVPRSRSRGEEWYEAKVAWYPTDADDDLVLLEISDFGSPIPPEQVAVCGSAEDSEDDDFRSYGFRVRGDYRGLFANGSIVSHIPGPETLLVEPLQLRSVELDSGMSGAPVFDLERHLVVGFVRQVYDPAGTSSKDPGLAWAVDAAVLAHSPVAHLLQDEPLLPRPAAKPEIQGAFLHDAAVPVARTSTGQAPEPLTRFVGRQEEIRRLDEALAATSTQIVALTGPQGIGKTSTAREWIRRLESALPNSPDVFWWTLHNGGQDTEDMLRALVLHLSGGQYDPDIMPTTSARANLAAVLLQTGKHVIVLDALDSVQEGRSDLIGTILSRSILDFLTAAANGASESLCVLTTQLPVVDLEQRTSFMSLPLGGLSLEVGRRLLEANGIRGSRPDMERIVEEWGGNALALAAVAQVLHRNHGGRAARLSELPDSVMQMPDVARFNLLGNLAEAHRTPTEKAALTCLAFIRIPMSIREIASVASEGFGVQKREAASFLDTLASTSACQVYDQEGLLLHPVLRTLYRAQARLLPTGQLAAIHGALAERYFAELERGGRTEP